MLKYHIRNRAKKNSLTTLNLTFLLLKTMFDSISRILLFSTWLYVINDGQFSSTKTVIAYYSTLVVLLVFNTIFTKQKDYTTARTWIGKHGIWIHLITIHFQKYFSIQQVLCSPTTILTSAKCFPKNNPVSRTLENSNMSQHFTNKLFTFYCSLS